MKNLIARFRDDAGMTLTELVIVLLLLSIVMITVYGGIVTMTRTEASTTNRFAATSDAQTMADRLTKDIRTAVAPCPGCAAFASASPQDLTFYANLSDPKGPTKIHIYITTPSGAILPALAEDSIAPDANSAPNFTYNGGASRRFDGQYLDSTAPIFTFFDADGVAIPPDNGSTITTASSLQSIDMVGMNIVARVSATSPKATIVTQVHVRNVDYNPGP